MKKTNEIHFGIQRKIVANMTTESWVNIPHVTYNYEPDVTEFMYEYKRLNENCDKDSKVTLNTLMLKIIVEGLKANPIMNSHIEFDKKLVRGHIQTFEDINISMPMILPNGEMMTINLHNFENKTLDEMVDYIADVYRRVENTDLNEVMMDVSMDNTINGLKEGKLKQTFYRIIGSKTGKHRVKTLNGKAKKEYYKIPESDRLTKHDIEQGTITVSNIGSAYREQRGATCLLEIVPPQICAIAVGAVQDRPVVIVNENGDKEIAIRQIMPLCIAFDHRALDFGEIVPFIKRLDEIFEAPEVIHSWKTGGVIEELDIEEIKHEREERETKFNESKQREKERREAEKAAEKAQREAEKALAKAKKEAAKAEKEALEAQKKVEKEKQEARKKAEKEALEAQKKAEKEAADAQKKAEEAQRKAEKEKEDARKKAEKEALEAKKRAEKEALEAKKRVEKEEKEKAKKEADRIKKETEKAKKEAEKVVKEIQKSKEREEKALKDIEKAKQEALKAQEKAEKAMAKVEEAEAHAEKIVSENK